MSKAAAIYATRDWQRPAVERLRSAGYSVEMNSLSRAHTHEELCEAVRGRDAVLCTGADRVDGMVFDAALPRCRIFATMAAGYENIDLNAATQRGIIISNGGRALTDTVADLAWALMLATARRLGEAERHLRTGRWTGWKLDEFLGLDVHGKTLGIVGFGRIGRAVARRAAGFEMRVLYHNRSPVAADAVSGARPRPLDDLMSESDFVFLLVPGSAETYHLIDDARLRRMKPSAVLINVARGTVVDEAALVRALRERRIAAAGLDVYEHEPRITPELLEMENVVLLPHIGSASAATRERMALVAAENVLAVLEGRPSPDRVV